MIKALINDILYPSDQFTPIPFWFFNDLPDLDRIRKQLQDYVEKGVNGIVLHPRIGVPKEIPYLSEKYFEAIRFIVKTADELQMKVVLYDEAMYPSGSAHGMVVAENPEYASKGIHLVQAGEDAAGEVIVAFKDGSRLVYGFTGGTIRGIHFGEDDGEDGAPKSADILNPDAVDAFIRMTHDRYYEELKEYFGSTVIAFFTDEPGALGRRAGRFREWIPGLDKEILKEGGSLEELKALFTKEKNAGTEIYHRLIKKYYREIFYRRLSEWCQNHNILLMGHPEASDDVEEQLYFQIPGQDLILRRVAPESGGLTEFDSVQAKLAADIARHLGRRRNANECFGVCYRNRIPWYFTAGDMKWYIDWLGIRGVNLFVPHAFYYSVEGARKDERPPDVGPNNIWWPHYRKISDYIKRLSYLMTDSVNGAGVAVLCDNNQVPYKELALLFEEQVEFNYLPIALLSECKIQDGKLCIREYQYEAVLNVTNPAWDGLVRTVTVEETDNAGLKLFHDAESLIAEGSYKTIHTNTACKDLRVSKLHKNGVEMFLFSNEGNQTIQTKVSLSADKADSALASEHHKEGMKAAVYVDLWRGEARMKTCAQDGLYEILLQPRETMLIVLQQNFADKTVVEMLPKADAEVFLGDFTDKFTLIQKEQNRAVYIMNYEAADITGREAFQVQAEEMVECFCNGELADVALWSPHRLRIGKFLREGNNELKLIITGSAANIYCDVEIPFGLGV
ncbi:MAG: hypothetical protein J6C54_04470 [Lachnospiraceae bacterium]|nr:hypothetical protein [Lachnospiraceae bacterium]